MAESAPPPDRLFEALQHDCRRELLLHLVDTADGSCDLHEAIDYLAEEMQEYPSADILALQCYHLHLPKLKDIGLVNYDWNTGELQYADTYPTEVMVELLDVGITE